MFFAREERARLKVHRNPPTNVVIRQPNRSTRVPDTCPAKKMRAMAREPTQAAKKKYTMTMAMAIATVMAMTLAMAMAMPMAMAVIHDNSDSHSDGDGFDGWSLAEPESIPVM